jgi:hypothetical protein
MLPLTDCYSCLPHPSGERSILTKTGFANDDGFSQEAMENHSNVRAFLGRDVIQAYMTFDGEIHRPGQRKCSNKFMHAAMDGHGRILAVTFGELTAFFRSVDQQHDNPMSLLSCSDAKLRLYKSLDDLCDDNYTSVALYEKIDLSRATIHSGGAHFIIFARQEHGNPILFGFGDNRFFQQGHDDSSSSLKFEARRVDFFDEGVSAVIKTECGDLHTAFLTEDGALYMSGNDVKGQCGGFSEQEPSLVIFRTEEEDIDVLDVACGATHTVVLTNKGIYVAGNST